MRNSSGSTKLSPAECLFYSKLKTPRQLIGPPDRPARIDESCANIVAVRRTNPQFTRSHSQRRASNPAFVSAGSSSCISIKFIDFSFSKWDGLIGDNFQRLALRSRGSNASRLLLEDQGR
jgi:hypothetical protein